MPTTVKRAQRPRQLRKKPPGRFHHGDLAEQLAVAAERLVEAEGHTALTMKALADRLGVSDAAIYRHYAGRDALLAEVSVRGFLRFVDAVRAAAVLGDDPFDAIRRYGQTYVRYAHANPGWFRLQFSRAATEGLKQVPGLRERYAPAEAARSEFLQLLRGALPPDAPRGPHRGDDPAADLYRLVWGTVHGLATFVVERVFQLVDTDEERIAAADDAIELLVASIRARAEAGQATQRA